MLGRETKLRKLRGSCGWGGGEISGPFGPLNVLDQRAPWPPSRLIKPRRAESIREKLFANRDSPGRSHKIQMISACYPERPASHLLRQDQCFRSTRPGLGRVISVVSSKAHGWFAGKLCGSRRGNQTSVSISCFGHSEQTSLHQTVMQLFRLWAYMFFTLWTKHSR